MIRRTMLAAIGCVPFCNFYKRQTESGHDQVMVAVGEASMCWEHPERAGVFDIRRAEDIGNRLRQHFADEIGDFATARRRVCDDMASDEGLRISYYANIAMAISDNSELSHEDSGRIANEIMRIVFEA